MLTPQNDPTENIDAENNITADAPKFVLDKVAFFGRTRKEYEQMFNLDLSEWQGKSILDCPSGPASFIAEATAQGVQAIGCDPLYGTEAEVLIEQGKKDIEQFRQRSNQVNQLFDFSAWGGEDNFFSEKLMALQRFATDYKTGLADQRYISAALPNLPFPDQSFDLVLSANFLFIYSDFQAGGLLPNSALDYPFHRQAVLELFRVCRQEARIYPVKTRNHKQVHPYLNELLADLNPMNISASLELVRYQDKAEANLMLKLRPSL
uniref:Methyltransferase type 11 domain-containing protein n=1 Tax=Cyanothece sp. (strain PCC 7425 / ATCC 29141) TaxID=395961 RepID=B8HRW1_CYAP4